MVLVFILTNWCWYQQKANTEIRLIIFFAAKDGEALNSQQKQDRDVTDHALITWLSCTTHVADHAMIM